MPEMLEDVPPVICCRMWFQNNRALTHFHQNDRQYLKAFPNRLIERNRSLAWLPRSPYMTTYEWGYVKSIIFRNTGGVADKSRRNTSSRAGKIVENSHVFHSALEADILSNYCKA